MTILVATARAHVRDEVLDVAIRLGETFGEELYVVHLVEAGTTANERSGIREELREQVLGENVAVTVAVEPVDTALVRSGPRLGEELLELATDVEVSHIVVGHSSKGPIAEVTRGNTAFAVADAAAVPVTVVPEGGARDADPAP